MDTFLPGAPDAKRRIGGRLARPSISPQVRLNPLHRSNNVTFGILTAMLALAAGIIYRTRLGRMGARRAPLTDDMIRQIEEHGAIHVDDEGLDMEHIREEEERFLEETWDEPDEHGGMTWGA